MESNWAPKLLKEHSKNWHLKITTCKKGYKQTEHFCICHHLLSKTVWRFMSFFFALFFFFLLGSCSVFLWYSQTSRTDRRIAESLTFSPAHRPCIQEAGAASNHRCPSLEIPPQRQNRFQALAGYCAEGWSFFHGCLTDVMRLSSQKRSMAPAQVNLRVSTTCKAWVTPSLWTTGKPLQCSSIKVCSTNNNCKQLPAVHKYVPVPQSLFFSYGARSTWNQIWHLKPEQQLKIFPSCFQLLLTTSELIREHSVVLFACWFVCYCLHEIQV